MKKILLALFVVGCFSTLCFAQTPSAAPVKEAAPVVEKKTEEVKSEQTKTVKKAKKKGKKAEKKAGMKANKEMAQ